MCVCVCVCLSVFLCVCVCGTVFFLGLRLTVPRPPCDTMPLCGSGSSSPVSSHALVLPAVPLAPVRRFLCVSESVCVGEVVGHLLVLGARSNNL
jgi:hypothetical protein